VTASVILDSSIWIEIARGNKKIITFVSPYLKKDKIFLVDLILAEVLRGARSEADYQSLQTLLEDLPMLSTNWRDVARLAYDVSRKGFNPPLADLYISNCAVENSIGIISKDKHFLSIASIKKFPVKLL
jgi:predicted nucleic acid-binding protein